MSKRIKPSEFATEERLGGKETKLKEREDSVALRP